MREVYESRATNIEHQKRLIKEAKDDVRRDMDDLKRSLEEQDRINEEKKLKQEMARTGLQGDVLMQVGEKERLKKRTY